MISIAVQNAQDLEAIMKDPDKIDTNGFQHKRNGSDPYKQFVSAFPHTITSEGSPQFLSWSICFKAPL